MKEKIGIYGGSFDPVHLGHLAVARAACAHAALDRVFFVPAKDQPFKGVPTASAQDRLHMLQLTIADFHPGVLCDFELKKQGVSYSVETAAYFQACFPEAELYFIMGEDSYFTLPRWYKSEELLLMVTPLVVTREGERRREIEGKAMYVPMPPMPISSTEIRRRIKEHMVLDDVLHPAVISYIREKGLYQA